MSPNTPIDEFRHHAPPSQTSPSPLQSPLNPRPLPEHAGRLKRLSPAAYRGRTCVHWAMTVGDRATGWLSDLLHARLREGVLQSCVRNELACPVYCLMPDHGHFLLMGVGPNADSRAGARLIRQTWNRLLRPMGFLLQRQAYDHVLRADERVEAVFQSVARYILENPVRAGLAAQREEWPFAGCLVPGYPSLDPRDTGFWPSFWLAYAALANERA